MNLASLAYPALAVIVIAAAALFLLRRRSSRAGSPEPSRTSVPNQGEVNRPQTEPAPAELQRDDGWQAAEEQAQGRTLEEISSPAELPDASSLEAQFLGTGGEGKHPSQRRGITLLGIRLDGMEAVNRRYGEKTGESALLQVAQAVQKALRGRDKCARWEANRFLALLPGIDRVRAPLVIHRVQRAVSALTLVTSSGTEIHLGASVGCASRPEDGASLDELLSAVRRELERVHAVLPEGTDAKPGERLRRAVPMISN